MLGQARRVELQGVGDVENRTATVGRALRERKIAKPCPTCKADIAEFLANAQVNRCGGAFGRRPPPLAAHLKAQTMVQRSAVSLTTAGSPLYT